MDSLVLDEDKRRFIEEDLYNELRWMLVAATEWNFCEDRRINGPHGPMSPSHLDVMTLDSASVHIRSLYDFFVDFDKKGHRKEVAYAKRDFGITLGPTRLFTEYIDVLNKRIFHLDVYRPAPKLRAGGSAKTDLNRQIAALAQDVLDLWDDFARQLPKYKKELLDARKLSVDDAEQSASSLGGKIIFI